MNNRLQVHLSTIDQTVSESLVLNGIINKISNLIIPKYSASACTPTPYHALGAQCSGYWACDESTDCFYWYLYNTDYFHDPNHDYPACTINCNCWSRSPQKCSPCRM